MRSRTGALNVAGLTLAGLLALAAALPAVWWEPLHYDEAVTLGFAPHSLVAIVREIFVQKGGAPIFFFVEHATLSWPGGIEGLRLPSVLFFLLALPATDLVARELCGVTEGILVALCLALAPLAVSLATFGRMYSLFLAATLIATWLCLRAGREPSRRRWIAAGAACGALVYVHPIAPLYSSVAVAAGMIWSGLPVRRALASALPGLIALGIVALPYVYALAVLQRRYHVGDSGSSLLATTAGRTIPEQAARALTPAGATGAVLVSLAALIGFVALLRERPRVASILALWLVVPVAFFSLVPAGGAGGTRFYDRYLIPALPAFLLLVVSGCLALGSLTGRRVLVGGLLVAALIGAEAFDDAMRVDRLHGLGLRSLATTVAADKMDAILFSGTGAAISDRPPELLDDYVALELPGIERVEELPALDPRYQVDVVQLGRTNLAAFLAGESRERVGIWIFRGSPTRIPASLARLARIGAVEANRVSPTLVVVRSREPAAPHSLVEQAYLVRRAWWQSSRHEPLVRKILSVDRGALGPD
jgi:Dolichyl-phosphate-mannose-protein mannosyltransferase